MIVTAGKATAADSRPTSSITSTNHDWFNSTGSITISWEADLNGDEIERIYFWACYYYDVVESCDGKEKDNWIRIKRHDIIDNDPKVEVISIDYLIAQVGDEEGYYKLITCVVNEDGIAEYGKRSSGGDGSDANGCYRYKTESHTTYFDSSEMKEFGFDDSAPEILIEIEPYSNDREIISYTITDLAGIKNFNLSYQYDGVQHVIESKELTGWPSGHSGTYQLCAECGEGHYNFEINSTDRLGHYSEASDNSIYDITSPILDDDFSITVDEDEDDKWLEVNDVVAIQWDSNEDIESVEIRYCLWDNILSAPTTFGWVGGMDNDGDTTSLTITNSLPEGLYYFYPVLTDLAGNPSVPEDCKENKQLSLDKSKPAANLEPEINGKFAYNTGTTITISISDNIELGDVVLRYSYESTLSDFIKSYDLSGQITVEITEVFYFPEGPGTYHFFLEVDDNHIFTSTTEVTMTLIYDIEAPESEIVFDGGGIPSLGVDELTNDEIYRVSCTATDLDHEVDKVGLYFSYKERKDDDFGSWSEEPTTIVYSETNVCTIDFDFEALMQGDGFYQFYTIAIDMAGNEEEKAEESELTIIRDSKSPEFELQSLESNVGEFLSFNFNTVYYKSENIGEGQYRINFTGILIDSLAGVDGTSGNSEQEWSLDGSILSIGYDYNTSKADEDQTITLTISDLAGNLAEITINFEEDNYAPVFTLYNSVLKKSIHDEPLLVRSDKTAILINVFNNGSSISSYQLNFDDSEWINLDPSNPSFSIPTGKNIVSLRVTDSLGNSISQNFTVEYDDEGPEFEPLNPSNNWYSDENNIYVRGPFTIELRASDNSSGMDRIEFRYEGDKWQEYTNPLELFEGTNIGPLHFSYRAIDNLGNLNEHEITFVIDNTATQMSQHDEYGLRFAPPVDFSLINFTFVSNSGDASKNSFWNGNVDVDIDYNLFNVLKLYPYLTKISDGKTGSGIKTILIEYSKDNETWMEYNNMSGIELTSSSIFIRVNVTDNVGNYIQYVVETPIKVINYPIEKEPEAEGNGFFVAVLLVVVAGSVVVYKYRQKQLLDLEKESGDIKTKPVEQGPPPIKCPKCSVLIPAESKSCAFCGTGWDDVGNIFLVNPFADSKKQITKEIIPRTGEILIGSNLDRWKIETGARSSIGGRENNEDSISWNTFLRTTSDIPHSIRLGIIADGVGGHNKGEIASSLVISAINKSVSKSVNDPFHTEVFTPQEHAKILESAYHHGNDIVFGKAQNDEYRGMATTAVSVYLWEDDNENNGFLIGNVGDSRGYLINKEEIKQVTKDDSEVQKLIDEGQITDKEAKNHPRKNVITQAIGNKKAIKPRIETYNLRNSEFDCILLCSDGVSDKITDKEIHKIVNQFDNPQDVCNKIVKIINRTNTNHDNVSLILIKLPNLFAGDY